MARKQTVVSELRGEHDHRCVVPKCGKRATVLRRTTRTGFYRGKDGKTEERTKSTHAYLCRWHGEVQPRNGA